MGPNCQNLLDKAGLGQFNIYAALDQVLAAADTRQLLGAMAELMDGPRAEVVMCDRLSGRQVVIHFLLYQLSPELSRRQIAQLAAAGKIVLA